MKISSTARRAYEAKVLPLDYIERQIMTVLLADSPASPEGVAGCVLAEVRDAGWEPPTRPTFWRPDLCGLIGEAAAVEYRAGVTPVSYAGDEIAGLIVVHRWFDSIGAGNGVFDWSDPALARRILGVLLDTGWVMPVWPVPGPEVPAVAGEAP